MKEGLPEGALPFHRRIAFRDIRKCTGSADLGTNRQTLTQVASHGPFGRRVNRWSTIRTGIDAGLTADASFFVRHHCLGLGGALSGACRTDIHTGGFFAVLADGGHEDGDFFPLLHPYPRKGRTARALVGEAASHFTGLATRASFRNDGDGAHLDILRYKFFTVNDQLKNILTFTSYLSSFF